MRGARNVTCIGEKRNVCRVLVGKPLGRLRCRWKDNIKMDLRETGWGDIDWIHLALDRDQLMFLANTAINLKIP
jgi:hypothetical protein